MDVQSIEENSSEAKSPLNHATCYTSLPESNVTAITHSNVFTDEKTETVDKAPITQFPASQRAFTVVQSFPYRPAININYMKQKSSDVPSQPSHTAVEQAYSSALNVGQPIPYRPVHNSNNYTEQNSSNVTSLPSQNTVEKACRNSQNVVRPVPLRPGNNRSNEASHAVNVHNSPSYNAMQPNPFLDLNDPNLTYLPHSQEVSQPFYTSNLPHTRREDCNLPLRWQFLSTSAHSSTSESIDKNRQSVHLHADNAVLHGRIGNINCTTFSTNPETVEEVQPRDHANIAEEISSIMVGAQNIIAQGKSNSVSSIPAEGSSSVDGELSSSSNAQLRSRLTKDTTLVSAFWREFNAAYLTDHGDSLASVMEADSADKRRGIDADAADKSLEIEAASADKRQRMEADAADKSREIEAASAGKRQGIEIDSADKRQSSSDESSRAVAPLDHTTSKLQSRSLALVFYICNWCGVDYLKLQRSVDHVRSAHKRFVIHLNDIIGEKHITFKCRLCSAKYSVRTDCVAHLINTHSAKQCKYCWKLYKNEELREFCEKRHIIKQYYIILCNKCDFRIERDLSTMKHHIIGAHSRTGNINSQYTKYSICLSCKEIVAQVFMDDHMLKCVHGKP